VRAAPLGDLSSAELCPRLHSSIPGRNHSSIMMAKEASRERGAWAGGFNDSDVEQHCPLCGFDEKWVPVGLRLATPKLRPSRKLVVSRVPPRPVVGTSTASTNPSLPHRFSSVFHQGLPTLRSTVSCQGTTVGFQTQQQGTELARMLPTSDTPANASPSCLEPPAGTALPSLLVARSSPGQTGGSELRRDSSTLDRLWISRCEKANKLCPLWAGVGDQQV
jgi:hypothetical protein